MLRSSTDLSTSHVDRDQFGNQLQGFEHKLLLVQAALRARGQVAAREYTLLSSTISDLTVRRKLPWAYCKMPGRKWVATSQVASSMSRRNSIPLFRMSL